MYWVRGIEEQQFAAIPDLLALLAEPARTEQVLCFQESRDGYRCGRHEYHDGRVHVAYDQDRHPVAAWTRS